MTRERPGAAGALALAVASGLAAVAAFPPFGLWPLAFVSAALLLLALAGQRPRFGFALGFASVFVLQCLFGWWLFPAGVRAEAYFAGAAWCALHAGVFGAGACWLRMRAPGAAPLALPSLWGVLEWGRASLGWLATPWCVLGYTQPGLAGVAALGGVWAVSFVVMGVGVALAALPGLRRDAPPRGAGAVALACALAGLLAGGAWQRRAAEAPSDASLRVAVLQAGRHVPGWDGAAHALEVFERYRELTRRAAAEGPALVVWPESALPASLPSDQAARAALSALARETGAHLLVASSGRDKAKPSAEADRWANSAFLFSPAGEIEGRYDKIRLLPFNEYVPLRRQVSWPGWAAGSVQDALPGAERTRFEVNGARFAVLICWENLFGGEFRASAHGVDFMVSLSNEAFIEAGPGREQLYGMNAFRAAETGVALARSATTGISAFVAPDGRELGRVADGEGRALDVIGYAVRDLPLRRAATPYVRFGDWIVAAEAAMLGAAAWAARRRGARAA